MKCNSGWTGCWGAKIGWLLLVIGGLNWGLIGIGGFAGSSWNVVNMILGSWMWLEWLVYVLVGLAALGSIFGCPCKSCKSACGSK